MWHRLLGTAAGATRSLYVDGVLAGASAFGNGTGTAPLWIGNNSTLASSMTGAVDDIRVWSRALTAEEARADYDLSRRGYPGMLNCLPLYVPARRPLLRRTLFDRVGSRGAA